MAHDGIRSSTLDDGDPAARRVQLGLLRRMGAEARLNLARSLTSTILCAHRDELLRAEPALGDSELCVRLVARWYGPELADRVRSHLERRRA